MESINYITYLSPGIPEEFFGLVVRGVGEKTGTSGSLVVESGVSGPPKGSDDPFSSGEVDVGFMCAPPFLWLCEREPSPVELLGVAPVPADVRAEGGAVYLSEVVVRGDSRVRFFGDLRGKVWAYNDACSMSGYFGVMLHLRGLGEDEDFFGEVVCSGSHARSLEMLLAGDVEVVAVDSNALGIRLRNEPRLRSKLRVVAGLGPFPVQPVVVRGGLSQKVKAGLREAFLGLDLSSGGFEPFGFERYVRVSDEHYAQEARFVREIGRSS